MAQLALRPMEFGEILDLAIELYRRNLPTLLGIYAVAAVPYVLLATPLSVRSLTSAPGAEADLGGAALTAGLSLALFVVYTVFISPLATGAMTVAVSERFLGRPASIGSAYRRVRRHLVPLIACQAALAIPLLVLLLLTLIGLVLAVILSLRGLGGALELSRITVFSTALLFPLMGGILLLFFAWFGFVPAAVVLEERGLGAIPRSLALVRGRFRRVVMLLTLLMLMVATMALYVRLPSQLLAGTAGLGGGVAEAVLGAVTMQLGILLVDPVRMVGITLVYYDLRIRSEAFDLALLAGELDEGA